MVCEDKLISYCVEAGACDDTKKKIKELINLNLDWNYIVRKSKQEKLSCFVYHWLKSIKNSNIPLDVLTALKKEYYTNATRNILAFNVIKEILNAFYETNIEVIVLKGLFLAEHIYKNIALREMSDIDILIKKQDLSRANKVLISLGYSLPAHHDFFLNYSGVSSVNTIMYNVPDFNKPSVHLHWHIINSTWPLDYIVNMIDMKDIWQKAKIVKIEDTSVSTMSYEHLLIYLSHHAFLHHFDRLILVYDIARVIRKYHDIIDWDLFVNEAEKFSLALPVYYSLLFVFQFLDINVPCIKRMAESERGFVFDIVSLSLRKGIRHPFFSYIVYLFMQKGFFSKLKFIARTFFPPRCVMAHNLNIPPSRIHPSHYFKRILINVTKLFETKM